MSAKIEVNDGVVLLSGELNMQTVPGVYSQLPEVLAQGDSTNLVFDLKAVTRSDSAGLGLLVECMQQAENRQAAVSFRNIPGQMWDIARMTGLDEVLPVAS